MSSSSHQSCHRSPQGTNGADPPSVLHHRFLLLCGKSDLPIRPSSTAWICKKLPSAATAHLDNSLSKVVHLHLGHPRPSPESAPTMYSKSLRLGLKTSHIQWRCLRSTTTWSSDKTCIARWDPVSLVCCWQSSGRLESEPQDSTHSLFIKYHHVPATWKRMEKGIRSLNTDTSKLRGHSGEAGLAPRAHNSKSNRYLNSPPLKSDAQLHWIPKKMNRTLNTTHCLNTDALQPVREQNMVPKLMLNSLLLITYELLPFAIRKSKLRTRA